MRAPTRETLARFGTCAEVAGMALAARRFGVALRTAYRWWDTIEDDPALLAEVRAAAARAVADLEGEMRATVAVGLAQLRADMAEGKRPAKETLRCVLLLDKASGGGPSATHGFDLPPALTAPRPDTPGVATPAPPTER